MKGIGFLFNEGVKGVWHNRSMSIASISILICCLLMTGVAVLFCMNMGELVEKIGGDNAITVYLDYNLDKNSVKKIGDEIKNTDNIKKVTFYSKEEGIKEFTSSLGDLADEFKGDENPLPDAYKITMTELSEYEKTVAKVQKIDGVYKVSNHSDVADMFEEISNIVARLGTCVVAVLIFISVFIVSTAIRATIHSRRFEISIMKSVGATNTFVRIPFIVEGLILGAVAGVISSILLKFLYEGLLSAIQSGYMTNVEMISFDSVVGYIFLFMVIAGSILGISGAMISMGRYLKLEGNELLGW